MDYNKEERDLSSLRITISISEAYFNRFPAYVKVIKSMYKLFKKLISE